MNRTFAIVFVLTSAAIIAAGTVSAEPNDVSCAVFLRSQEFSGMNGMTLDGGSADLPLSSLVFYAGEKGKRTLVKDAVPDPLAGLTLRVDVDFDTEVGGEDAISLVPHLLAPDGAALQEQQALHLWTSVAGDHVGVRSQVRYGDVDLSYVISCHKVR